MVAPKVPQEDGTFGVAGHKGYAIAVMMDMLSGVLAGSFFGGAVYGTYQREKHSGCGRLIPAA